MTVELVQENRIEPEKADTPRIPFCTLKRGIHPLDITWLVPLRGIHSLAEGQAE